MPDLEVVRIAREGDEAAFEEIVRRYGPRVFRVASQFFRRRELVEEASQDAFLRIYSELASYDGRGSFEGWISRITTNICLNMLRSSRRRPESPVADLTDQESEWLERKMGETSDPRTIEADVIAADLAEKVLETLSPDDRAVLVLMDGNDLSVKDVVGLTGWSESKVKVQAMRARRRMRLAVEKLLGRTTRAQRVTGK